MSQVENHSKVKLTQANNPHRSGMAAETSLQLLFFMMTWFKSHTNSLLPFGPSCSSSGHRHPGLCSYRKSRDVTGVTTATTQLDLSVFTDMEDSSFSFRNPWESWNNRSCVWETIPVQQAGHRIWGWILHWETQHRNGKCPKSTWFFSLGVLQ